MGMLREEIIQERSTNKTVIESLSIKVDMLSDMQDEQKMGLQEMKRMLYKSRLEEAEKKKASSAFLENLEERLLRLEKGDNLRL